MLRLFDHVNPSGALAFSDGAVVYERRGHCIWQLPSAEVAVVGAYTTNAGPFADDYFLVLVGGDGAVYEAPVYADGCAATVSSLGTALGAVLRLGLANSAEWRTEVVWPPVLAGAPLLEESGALTSDVVWYLAERRGATAVVQRDGSSASRPAG